MHATIDPDCSRCHAQIPGILSCHVGKPPKCILRYIARVLAQLYSVYNVLRSAPCKRVQYVCCYRHAPSVHAFQLYSCLYAGSALTLSSDLSASGTSGSCGNTSSAAPPIRCALSAFISASVSITPPRDVLIISASDFIKAMRSALTSPRGRIGQPGNGGCKTVSGILQFPGWSRRLPRCRKDARRPFSAGHWKSYGTAGSEGPQSRADR